MVPNEGIEAETISGFGGRLPLGGKWVPVEGTFSLAPAGEQIFLYCNGALGGPVPLASIAYGPTATQNTIADQLQDNGAVVIEGPFPNWIYNGPIESVAKLELQQASKDPANWKGATGRVSVSSASSVALQLTILGILFGAIII